MGFDDRPATRLQVSGHRFLTRRMLHALVRGDARMLDDPLRAQSMSLMAGAVLAAIAVAGCAVLAFLRPQGEVGTAPILVVRESGALYVRIDDTVHPVPNLASARLAARTAADPAVVSARAVEKARRGPQVGIPGAPSAIGVPLTDAESGWAVCDTASRTAVSAGATPDGDRLAAGDAVLVTPRAESASTTYLLYDGRRALVDLRDRAVTRALRLEGVAPRPVSRSLLDAIPEAPPITAPVVPRVGSPGPAALAGYPVGTVLRLERAGATEHHVVLPDGVQRVEQVTADLVRLTVTQPRADIPTVAATALASVATVETLDVASFPAHVHTVDPHALCVRWTPGPGGRADVDLVGADTVTGGPPLLDLAQADADGLNVDAVAIPAGRSAFVRAVGAGGAGATSGPLYLVTDLGVVFGVRDAQAAADLGLAGPAAPAPWPVLRHLPRGPELSRERASVVRDAAGAAG